MATYDEIGGNGVRFWLRNLDERVKRIEELKPDVLAYELGEVKRELRAVRRLLGAQVLALIVASISFAFTVLAASGRI